MANIFSESTGVFLVAIFIGLAAAIYSIYRSQKSLWRRLYVRFGVTSTKNPEQFPESAATVSVEIQEEQLVGWVIVTRDGLLFRPLVWKKSDQGVFLPWKNLGSFWTESDGKMTQLVINGLGVLSTDAKIYWDAKVSALASQYFAEAKT